MKRRTKHSKKTRPSISLVVAMTNDYVIGFSKKLPWRLSADLRRFRKLTIGKVVVMGRLTYESIGHPLPNRTNVVVSRQRNRRIKGCHVVSSLDSALQKFKRAKSICVIGGGQLYAEALPVTDRIYVTLVELDRQTRVQPFLFDQPIDGDAFFPQLDASQWRIKSRGKRRVARPRGAGFSIDEKEYPSAIYFRFLVLDRRKIPTGTERSGDHFATAFGLPADMLVPRPLRSNKTQRTARKRPSAQPDLFK